ncbi:MAG: hypothetical protein IT555_11965 [Acetobacteraceae bacterium]|nr:hypothetical protein [Acetobacteraceae bacterium]
MEWILELALVGLLLATMFHAVRLERALGVLKRDRAALEELVVGFNASTRAAEQGISRLKEAADGAGRQIARQVEAAVRLKDDLVFLGERGDVLADRLDHLVRTGRTLDLGAQLGVPPMERPMERPTERPMERPTERSVERPVARPMARPTLVAEQFAEEAPPEAAPLEAPSARPRSQAERDLMRALRIAR